ncbi:MAG: HAD family hydrolase [Motilibacteraceae bacterium]
MSSLPQSGPLAVQAVLFDMDGTLVDTEPYWIAAEHALVEEFGGTWSDEHAHNLVGNPLTVSADYIRKHGNVPLSTEEVVERLLDDVVSRVLDHVPWRPGARELLEDVVAGGVPTALVTMSYTRLAEAVVAMLPAGSFSTLVTGDVVANGKPHPEPYLTAAATLGVDPVRCVALEDSVPGVTSAEAAGCVTVGVPHVVPVPPAAGRILVGSLAELSLAALDDLVRQARG